MRLPTLCITMGGGTRQLEHATGVFKALDEKGIVIDKFRGASAGSAINGLRASGLSGKTLEFILRNTRESDLFGLDAAAILGLISGTCTNTGVLSSDGLTACLKKYLDEKASMEKTLVSVCEYPSYRNSMIPGSLDAIRASVAIEEVFEPVKLEDGCLYGDGGAVNNIPMIPFTEVFQYSHIYVILCNQDTQQDGNPSTKLGRVIRLLNITMDREIHQVEQEDGWSLLPNVTIFKAPPYRSGLLTWSDNYGLIDWSYKHAMDTLSVEKTTEAFDSFVSEYNNWRAGLCD